MTKREFEARRDRDPPLILKDFLTNSEDKLKKLKQDAKTAQVSLPQTRSMVFVRKRHVTISCSVQCAHVQEVRSAQVRYPCVKFGLVSCVVAVSQEAYASVVEYFGENAKTLAPNTFFSLFSRFSKAYKVSHGLLQNLQCCVPSVRREMRG